MAVCAYWLPGAAAVCGPLRSLFGVRDRLDAVDEVLLTFDDGPHPQATPAVLDLLRARHALDRARSRGTPLFHLQLLLGCTALRCPTRVIPRSQ